VGYEVKCRVRVVEKGAAREADGTVLLETDELVVRGDARVRIKRTSIQRVARSAGTVTVTAPSATLTLTLDEAAATRWERKLRELPKRLIDKLDVKPEAAVLLIGTHDDDLCGQLAERTSRLSRASGAKNRDVVFVDVSLAADMPRIARAKAAITDDGAIWVVHPKGPTGIADTAIFAKAKALGLSATKVARVSDTLTAEKLVRPLASRRSARKAKPKDLGVGRS
jgi:uncharacterized radical SAM superfamily Fe-S cluster-containing enzyme